MKRCDLAFIMTALSVVVVLVSYPTVLIPGIYSHPLWNLLRVDMMYAHMCLGCSCMLGYAEC